MAKSVASAVPRVRPDPVSEQSVIVGGRTGASHNAAFADLTMFS